MRRVSLKILMAFASLALVAGGSEARKYSPGEERSARSLAGKISAAGIKMVVVADFLEDGKKRMAEGVFLAGRFSKGLSEQAKTFKVLDRQLLFALLQKEKIAAADLMVPENIRRVGATLGADALLIGRLELTGARDKTGVSLSLAGMAADQALAAEKYQVDHTPEFLGYFPPSSDLMGTQFYFPGYDGITEPECMKCPNPSYTDEARKQHFQGTVVYSVLVTTEGKIAELKLLQSAGHGLDEATAAILKTWQLKPAVGPSGQPVPVRVAVETTFRLS